MDKKVKILHITTSLTGGAGVATYRLHKKLKEKNFDSKILLLEKKSNEKELILPLKNKYKLFIKQIIGILLEKFLINKYKKRENIIFSNNRLGINILENKDFKEADIVHLHWINRGFLTIELIKKICKIKKKVIWTFHDSWPFTGGCHVRYGCYRYITGCGCCPILKSNKKMDLSFFNMKIKKDKLKDIENLHIIAPSNWLRNEIEKSPIYLNKEIKVIPNILDEKIFKKIDKTSAKNILNLDINKKYILFGACSAIETPYKGYSYLKKALNILSKKFDYKESQVEILIFGSYGGKEEEDLPYKINFLGEIKDETKMMLIYNASNVFVGPSLEESFGQTFNESISCGTPAVSFESTGVSDVIEHKKNGYLAKYKNAEDLAKGIHEYLNSKQEITSNFTQKEIIEDILNLYFR